MQMNSILIFIAFLALMYFMMVRPQQKAAKKHQEMLQQLQPGTEVVTIGGLHGVIDHADEKTITLDADGVLLTFERAAIKNVVTPAAPEAITKAEPVEEDTLTHTDRED
ncbi:preprotein translocase subunit YajC [Weissella kandleri]|uniref:preprotein translocase subunit YajC n=1 Tax=Weissella kandleri TaxID=1616 RepID=UPI00387EB63B